MKPLRFTPIYKQTLWGGNRIAKLRGLSNATERIGESWELSGVVGQESIISEGEHQGKTLRDVLKEMKEELVGKSCWATYNEKFPLLIKFIDAQEKLSIQVHPNDAIAQELNYPSGKTEMWYVLESEISSEVVLGFKDNINLEQYKRITANDTLVNYLQHYKTEKGNCYFVPPGTVHNIGAGNFILEIQQASDLTFRIYDFDRVDKQGKKRELHTSLAEKAINFESKEDYLRQYEEKANDLTHIIEQNEFKVGLISLFKAKTFDYSTRDSFIAWTIIEGEAEIIDINYNDVSIVKAGETLLWPANIQTLNIRPLTAYFKCLEVSI